MNSILLMRVFLTLVVGIVIILIFILYSTIKKERRISRYSLKMHNEDNVSYFDRLHNKYFILNKKLLKNERLVKYSTKYEKYLDDNDKVRAIGFLINKLVIALLFVMLVIISSTLRGKLINFVEFILSFIFGYYIFDVYLILMQKRRKAKIKNDMLRAVIIMNNAFKVGKSTLQAVSIASRDLPSPINREFKKIAQDMSYGLSVDVAFQRFAKRVKLEEANYLASSLTILNKTGGNIVNVFSSIEKTLFDKKKLESDLKNSTAATNLVVKILMVIPILFALIIYLISPNYFDPLFNSMLGLIILFIIWAMLVIYVYILNRVMKVKI